MTGGDGGSVGDQQHIYSPNSPRRPPLRKSPSSVRAWLIARDAGFTSRFKTGPLSRQVVLQGAFCFCNVISMVDTLFCSYVLDFLVYTVHLPGSLAGSILMASELFNVVVGVVASIIMDHYPFPNFGKHRFWTVATVIPLFLTFTALWWPFTDSTSSASDTLYARAAYYTVALLLFNVFYGTLIVAYEGSIPLLASDSSSLTRINVLRLCIGSCSALLAVVFAAVIDIVMQHSPFRYLVQGAVAGGVVALVFGSWVVIAEEKDCPPPALMRQGSTLDQLPVFLEFRPTARGVLRRRNLSEHHYNIDQYRYQVDRFFGGDGGEEREEEDSDRVSVVSLDLPASLPEEEFWGSTTLGGSEHQRQVEEDYSQSAPCMSVPDTEGWESDESSPRVKRTLHDSPGGSRIGGSAHNSSFGLGGVGSSTPTRTVGFSQGGGGAMTGQNERTGSLNGLFDVTPGVAGSNAVSARSSWSRVGLLSAALSPMHSDLEVPLLPAPGNDKQTDPWLDSPFQMVEESGPASPSEAEAAGMGGGAMAGYQNLDGVGGKGRIGEGKGGVHKLVTKTHIMPRGGGRGGGWWAEGAEQKQEEPVKNARRHGLQLWLHYSGALLGQRPFWTLIANHFVLWGILTFTQAALPAFVHTYLAYDEIGNIELVSGSVMVIVVLQVGHAIAQIAMGIWPESLHPELIVRISLLIMAAAKMMFLFAFEKGLPPKWVFLVAGVDGLGQGGLFAAYEIMVPEVVWDDEASSGVRKENLVYGWVDSTRELSLALSFFGTGFLLENVAPGLAERLCVGFCPLPLIALCGYLHWLYPHILISKCGPHSQMNRTADSDADLEQALLPNKSYANFVQEFTGNPAKKKVVEGDMKGCGKDEGGGHGKEEEGGEGKAEGGMEGEDLQYAIDIERFQDRSLARVSEEEWAKSLRIPSRTSTGAATF